MRCEQRALSDKVQDLNRILLYIVLPALTRGPGYGPPPSPHPDPSPSPTRGTPRSTWKSALTKLVKDPGAWVRFGTLISGIIKGAIIIGPWAAAAWRWLVPYLWQLARGF